MTDVPIGTLEERRALRMALAARCTVRVTSEARGAAPQLDAAFDALLLPLLPSEAPGLPAAALRDFLGVSTTSREGRVLSDSLKRLRDAGVAQMLPSDRERRHWRGAQDAKPAPTGPAPAVPAGDDRHDDVWCMACGATIGNLCCGPRGQSVGAHKRRVSDSLALRADRQRERAREAAGAKAAASAAKMSKTEPCALHQQSAALEAAVPAVNQLLLTLQDAGLSARLQAQVCAGRCTCRSLRVLTHGVDHSTMPYAEPAPAPWPPHLGEAPWLTAHHRVVVPEQRLRTPRDLNTLVAALLALRAQMGDDAGDEGEG